MTASSVASIVVHYGRLANTIRCVESLLASHVSMHSVLIVDNTAGDHDADVLASHFGARAEVVRSMRNRGYGGGANLGMRSLAGTGVRFVWVLNNDAIVEPDTLGRLVDAMSVGSRIGALSPQILASPGPEAPAGVWYAGGSIVLSKARAVHHQLQLEPTGGPVPTGFVTGCAILLRREAVEEVGLFWEHLFLYWEDVDLSLRLVASGWDIAVLPEAIVTHYPHSSVTTAVARRYHYRNALLVAKRHGTRVDVARALASLTRSLARDWVAALARRREAPWPELRGLASGICGILRVKPGPPTSALEPVPK